MSKRVSKKANWFKENTFTPDDEIYVGIDVHKRNYHVAIWYNGRIGCVYSMSSDNHKLLRDLEQMQSALKKIVYEAGPTGYGLVRLLRSAHLPADVVAVSKTPRMNDSSAKTDRLDCQQLAEYAAKNLLTFVTVPTERQESDRQVVRLRDQLASKRLRVMQQVKSLLLQHNITISKSRWSEGLVYDLRQLKLSRELKFTLN